MRELAFLCVVSESPQRVCAGSDAVLPVKSATVCSQSSELWATRDGRLRVTPLSSAPMADTDETLVATVWYAADAGHPVWYLVSRSSRLAVNGSLPLPLARLEPGCLFSLGRTAWFVSTLWRPVPQSAPPEVADKPCPLCGAPLSAAPVVQCPSPGCGRWMHLERPEDPDSQDTLNCYLTSGQCGDCHRTTSLEPLWVPEPHDKLTTEIVETAGAPLMQP